MDKGIPKSTSTIIKIALLVLLAALSLFVLSVKTTSVENHSREIQQIDEKIDTVLELTAASTASSAIISLLPDDQATPIAEKLADFSSYFLIALCALYLEKYLISLVGYASFGLLLPVACGFGIFATLTRNKFMRNFGLKLGMFSLIIYFIIPTSVKISDMIYETYSVSIQQTIDEAEETANMSEETGDTADGTDTSQSIVDRVVDIVKETASTITGFATDILSDFIEALAVMLVTSCLIPVLVLAGFVWIAKLLFSIPITDQTVLTLPDGMMEHLHR